MEKSTVGLRELRQNASDVIRRAESGDVVTVTVNGRAVAQVVPMGYDQRWRTFDEIKDLFRGPGDPTLDEDLDFLDQTIRDPYE